MYREALLVGRSRDEVYVFERSWDEESQSILVEYDEQIGKNERAIMIKNMLDEKEVLLYELYRKAKDIIITKTAWEWIVEEITVIPAGADYSILPLRLKTGEKFAKELCKAISKIDTGITDITFRDKPIVDELRKELPDGVKKAIFHENKIVVAKTKRGDIYLFSADEKNNLEVKWLMTVHKHGEKEFNLPFSQESDGTVRYMHLFPIILDLLDKTSRSVYLVDEIDRSIHPNLIIDFIGSFLDGRGDDHKSQLIFTTHNLEIMGRNNLMRHDEKWIVDKQANGTSLLQRVSDYALQGVRNTSDILKIYRNGMMGGVPRQDWNNHG